MSKIIKEGIIGIMNTITLPKIEYLNMHKAQKELKQRLDLMEKILMDFTKDEIISAYANKLKKISADMDKGVGIKFDNAQKVKNYLHSL
ncbi:TPA: hypothetical protein DEW47_02935 [Patescibacteria group bacterium]|nr:hypothetical protein [Patescibacteria group bacterium]HCI04907.1 hypothetical protein [Patescibacteria group bacterium]